MAKQNMSKDEFQAKKTKGLGLGLGLTGGVLGVAVGAAIWLQPVSEANATEVTVYKSPACGCCKEWVKHMEEAGFKVTTKNINDVTPIKEANGVGPKLRSCHTALVDGYVVEGHVPANDIKRMLKEKPPIAGLATPGMPMGSPGMEGNRVDPYDVVSFDAAGNTKIYARY